MRLLNNHISKVYSAYRSGLVCVLVKLVNLNRFESLGENCEFGFLMRSHQFSSGGFFRWSFTPLHALIHILGDDFQAVFRFENLRPRFGSMVHDSKYDILFHSLLRSDTNSEGVLEFLGSDEEQHSIYRKEKEKVDYLVAKFRSRLKQRGLIYVLKSFTPPSADQLDRLFLILEPVLQKHNSYLLVVTPCLASPNKPGRVEWVGPHLLRAYVAFMAPGESADKLDYDSWNWLIIKTYWMTSPLVSWLHEILEKLTSSFPGSILDLRRKHE